MGLGKHFQGKIDRIADRFVLEILQSAALRNPDNLEVLFELGDLLTRLGHIKEGLAVDRKLSSLLPEDPTVHYNLACSYSLLAHHDEAFAELQRAIQLGYDDDAHMRQDQDLAALRQDPRFEICLRTINKGS